MVLQHLKLLFWMLSKIFIQEDHSTVELDSLSVLRWTGYEEIYVVLGS